MTTPLPKNPSLSNRARKLLDAPRFATIATVDLDGTPRQAVVWYLVAGDELVINSAEGRHWPANLRRDPRISFSVEDGYDYVTLTGRVEVDEDQRQAHADIASMARLYHADDPEAAEREIAVFESQHRITFRLRPSRIYEHFD